MNKILIRNISGKELKLTYLLDESEFRILLGANEFIIADENKTPTMTIFENRGFIEIESVDKDKIKQIADDVLDNIEKKLEEKKESITLIRKEINDLQALDAPDTSKEETTDTGDVKMGKWTEDEVKFLRKNYPKHGRSYCVEHLNRTTAAVQSKIDLLGLKKKSKN